MKGGQIMHDAINSTRRNLLKTQLGGICVGCVICIVLSKIMFKGNTAEVQTMNPKIALFMGLIALYVGVYFATLRGFFAKKIKALKNALDVMLYTDEDRILVEHTGLFGRHVHGEYYKDRLGFIHYTRRPCFSKAKIVNKLEYLKNDRRLIPMVIGGVAVVAAIMIMRL